MSSRSAKKRAKLQPPDLPLEVPNVIGPDATEIQQVDEWVPNYERECEVCGQVPCVTGIYHGKVVYEGTMCGVCTWGEAACIDPANW
jgi:hypothetical protein